VSPKGGPVRPFLSDGFNAALLAMRT
jgi:hypothetical protein